MKNTLLHTPFRIAGVAAIVLSAAAISQVPGWAQPVANVASTEPAGDSTKVALAAIPKPNGEIESKAYAALDKHCARCHQDGKLEDRAKSASGFGNVLHLADIAKNTSLVVPGNPDNSELVKQIASGNMPYDIKDGSNIFAPTPKDDEVAAIRTWIVSLADKGKLACGARKFISNEDIVNTIAADMEAQPEHRVATTRYVTLTHLYNACAEDKEMNVYRQAVIKLVNSLSRQSDVVRLSTSIADEAKTILRINLLDVGWTSNDWEKLASTYPYAVKPDMRRFDFVSSQMSTKVPFLRGDWLAFTASRPPVYHDLLRLPATYGELQKNLDVDVADNIAKFLAKRSGFQRSFVSQNNRLIERHTISTGYFWTSYDFAGNKGTQSLFEHPLGPSGDSAFKHDGGETLFSLPNGFNAYYLYTAAGERLDKGPTEIVRDIDRKDLAVTNGISCFGCHDQGIRLAKDDIRKHVIDNRNFPKRVREAVEAMYPPQKEMDELLAKDAERFKNAMLKADLDPSLKLGGIEIIGALSKQYENNLDLRQVASEFGLSPENLQKAAGQVGGDAQTLVRRLEQQGYVPRDNLEGTFAGLVPSLSDDDPIFVASPSEPAKQVAKVNSGDNKAAGAPGLSIVADKSAYAVNDLPVFTVRTDKECYLTLINVDGTGTGTVIYPNKFQQQNVIKAGQNFKFPSVDAPFQFRFKDPGTETVIALCNANQGRVDTIAHDFSKKQFTELGNYEKFVTRAIVVEASKKPKKVASADKKIAKIAKRSGIARSAIKIAVK
ncbi:MAG: DUF4384 domain-containing protein [Rhizobiales bacterium]|nr:DUF4384 domain-containing protein [Hyphomicrobiales bacterium]